LTYLREDEPLRGIALEVLAGVRRVIAPNPGPMTYHGTNTYLIETQEGLVVLDPGPADDNHIHAVADACGEVAAAIVLSHGHYDHCAGASALQAKLGVPIFGHSRFRSSVANIDNALDEGDVVCGLRVLFTPGHAPDHICLELEDGVVFTGDHVMAWSSSVVPYPTGDMSAFIASLQRLADRNDTLYLCGHGPLLPSPSGFVQRLIDNRLRRETAILEAVRGGMGTAEAISERLYRKRGTHLRKAAEHNVRSHLEKLLREGLLELRDGHTLVAA
tara:strand:+ start:1740 stop:2561 length:822 start_codon:yes stop_codon:yes gene_type:complete